MYVMHLAEVFVIWAYFMISSSCRPMSEDEHTFACQSDDIGSEFKFGMGFTIGIFLFELSLRSYRGVHAVNIACTHARKW